MGAPVLMGAGIGALASLATGNDPLRGAALGGLGGGAFGGAGGFGSGFTEGGLFNLGSNLGGTLGAEAATSAGTAFGASQSPSALLSSGTASAIQPSTTSTLLGGEAALPQYNMGMGGVTGAPSGFTGDIASSTIATPEFINPALTSDPSKLGQAETATRQTFTDGIADPIRPRFDEPIRVTEQATKAGGYEKPLFTKAYEGLSKYATENPLVAAQLGLTAIGGINPPERQGPAPSSISGSVSKGTPPSTPAQPLRIRRPR